MTRNVKIEECTAGHRIIFNAMASPCEIIIESSDRTSVENIASLVSNETWRIEDKFSRYQSNNTCSKINNSNNKSVDIDTETFELLKFAEQCYQISDGLFDITSGVLRKVWRFDGSSNVPTSSQIDQILPFVGWEKISYSETKIVVPHSMEVDFGGIGKEYAVDKICQLIQQTMTCSALVNFGGDLAVTAPRVNDKPWSVGIDLQGISDNKSINISFTNGAIATSGDANRYLKKDGKRYSHILNPKTGWPIENAPSSITVASTSCLNAGIIATIAILQGEHAEVFLTENQFKHWCFRG
jgi:thiamine biosynthesis lipoprotein